VDAQQVSRFGQHTDRAFGAHADVADPIKSAPHCTDIRYITGVRRMIGNATRVSRPPKEAIMYLPGAYLPALAMLIVCMICWGSWANTQKVVKSFRFELFYWDYIIGMILTSIAFGFTLGSAGDPRNGLPFLPSLQHAAAGKLALALFSGIVFNMANILLVAAIAVAGPAVAFPVGIGLALIIGTVGNYILKPDGNPVLLFGGMGLVATAIVLDALAYRAQASKATAPARTGILLSLACGVLMGLFYPVFAQSISGAGNLTPYSGFFVFSLGAGLCTFPAMGYFMRRPVSGRAVRAAEYFSAPWNWHIWGVAGGVIWSVGTMFNFMVGARQGLVGPAVSYSLGQGATLVSAIWGVFIWKEFQGAHARVYILLTMMFACFLAGLVSIATAPLVR
jgi:glucose uptake protein